MERLRELGRRVEEQAGHRASVPADLTRRVRLRQAATSGGAAILIVAAAGLSLAGIRWADTAFVGQPGDEPSIAGPASPSPTTDRVVAELPGAVEETRQAILEAARTRDWEALRRLIPDRGFPYSIGDSIGGGEEATAFWQDLEETGEPVLPTLVTLLEGHWAIDRPGQGVGGAVMFRGEVLYQWPAASAKNPEDWTPEDLRQLRQVATEREIREYRENGYFGSVVGIGADGTWFFYIVGD